MILTRRWFALFLLGGIPIALSAASRGYLGLVAAWDGLLLMATIVDYFLLPERGQIELARRVDDHLALGAPNAVQVSVRNGSAWPWRLVVRDEPPAGMDSDFADTSLQLGPGSRKALTYHVRPTARGDYRFGDLWYRVRGRLGLVAAQRKVSSAAPVKVYPNMLEAARFTLMARRGRLQQVGIRAARLVGAGREFESLRDYQPDDDYRRIDWKATARRGRLTSREYEVERSQNVVLVLDVGRTMLAEVDGIAKVDYAVNAALLLAYVATLSDDKVGLLVFADAVQTWIAPARGRSQVYTILEALYNARARRAEPDYRTALAYLNARWRRRSLMVCFTDLWDPDSARQTMAELAALQPRHLVACVTLMDTRVLRRAQADPVDMDAVFEQAVARQMLDDRARAVAELQQRGVLVVDSPADQLSAALVNRYLEVKERMLL
ncbi:MAG: DUF58 domain-containing protein [Chthonomonadales bacterium]|nr:DUF58 domain-containing protein [Chthonomonadales bacterium]